MHTHTHTCGGVAVGVVSGPLTFCFSAVRLFVVPEISTGSAKLDHVSLASIVILRSSVALLLLL